MNLGVLFYAALMAVLIGVFWFLGRRRESTNLRDIPAYYRMKGALELAVEDGSRIHVSIGRNDITSPHSGMALMGLSMVREITRLASDSDRAPQVSTGNATLGILAQDTMRATTRAMGLASNYSNTHVRIAGLTPFSFSAGAVSLILDGNVSANVITGSFRDELALLTTTANQAGILTFGGTDTLSGQAVVYASADDPLIGEEVFASVAYLSEDPLHVASLHAQDVVRWLIILFLIVGALSSLFGGAP